MRSILPSKSQKNPRVYSGSIKKPRKRRTQTIADKGTDTAPVLFRWTTMLGTYSFFPCPAVRADLVEKDGVWYMAVKIDGQKYSGKRSSLEDAFKATDALLFKHARRYWLKSDASVVLAPWKGILP